MKTLHDIKVLVLKMLAKKLKKYPHASAEVAAEYARHMFSTLMQIYEIDCTNQQREEARRSCETFARNRTFKAHGFARAM